jgi:hypothetical protein
MSAATGFYFGGLCYPTADEARLAHCGNGYPVQAVVGGEAVSFSCGGIYEEGLLVVRSSSAASAPEAAASLPTSYVACNPYSVNAAVITPETAAAAWAFGFTIVGICYLVSWAAQQISAPFGRG